MTFPSFIFTGFLWLLTFLPWQNYSHDMRIQRACRSGFIFVDLRYLFDTHMPLFYKQSGMIFCHKEQLLNLPFAFTSPQRKQQNIPLLSPHGLILVVQCFFLFNVQLFSLVVITRCFVLSILCTICIENCRNHYYLLEFEGNSLAEISTSQLQHPLQMPGAPRSTFLSGLSERNRRRLLTC